MFTLIDLNEVRERAGKNFTQLSPRTRLEGMTVDLHESDLRILALYEAALVVANRKLGENRLNDAELAAVFPKTHQASQEPIEGENVSYNLTQQK